MRLNDAEAMIGRWIIGSAMKINRLLCWHARNNVLRNEMAVSGHYCADSLIIGYLYTTRDLWLTFGGNRKTLLEGYCDADWASQPHCHSLLGYSFHYGMG